jgi:hypothetical protein
VNCNEQRAKGIGASVAISFQHFFAVLVVGKKIRNILKMVGYL